MSFWVKGKGALFSQSKILQCKEWSQTRKRIVFFIIELGVGTRGTTDKKTRHWFETGGE